MSKKLAFSKSKELEEFPEEISFFYQGAAVTYLIDENVWEVEGVIHGLNNCYFDDLKKAKEAIDGVTRKRWDTYIPAWELSVYREQPWRHVIIIGEYLNPMTGYMMYICCGMNPDEPIRLINPHELYPEEVAGFEAFTHLQDNVQEIATLSQKEGELYDKQKTLLSELSEFQIKPTRKQ